MPLIYSSVSQGSVTLAEYAVCEGNFRTVAREYISKLDRAEGKTVFLVDGHSFNFLNSSGFTFLVVADEEYGRAIPVAFLDRVSREWGERRVQQLPAQAAEGSLSGFSKQLRSLVEQATQHPAEFTKVAAVQSRVEAVKGIMVENIGRLEGRGERLEALDAKTEVLQFEADRFVRTARTLRRQAWWQSCKLRLLVGASVLLLALVIFLLVCFSGGNCLRHGG